MHNAFRSKAWGRLAGIAASCFGAIALAGCATEYVYVQPEVANGGGYYTGDGSYSGQGYYDEYGTGPYYPGTSGYGYYNGTFPYFGAFEPWGGFAGGGGYFGYYPAPGLAFDIGISNVWNFPGYWGPWYSTVIPVSGCLHGCNRYDWNPYHHHGWQEGHHHASSHVAVVPASDSRPTTGRGTSTGALAVDPRDHAKTIRARRFEKPLPTLFPPGQFGNGYRRAPTSFVRHGPARAPVQMPTAHRAVAGPTRPAYFARPVEPTIVDQRVRMSSDPAPEPRDFRASPAMTYGAPVPKSVNRGALTRDPPTTVYRRSNTYTRSSTYRPAVPATSSPHGDQAHKPRIH